MNIVIGDYNINIKHNPVINRLKDIDYYKKIPELFLETYTDLYDEDIDEIVNDSELLNIVLENVYNNLTINDEQRFIKITNNSLAMLNSIDGMLILFLERYYGFDMVELMKMSAEELLTLFIFNLKTREAIMPLDIGTLKEILCSFYSEDTVNDFIDNCGDRLKKQAQSDFEKELEQLNNI